MFDLLCIKVIITDHRSTNSNVKKIKLTTSPSLSLTLSLNYLACWIELFALNYSLLDDVSSLQCYSVLSDILVKNELCILLERG